MRSISFLRFMHDSQREWTARGIAEPLNDTIILNTIATVSKDLSSPALAKIMHDALDECARRLQKAPILVSEEELERMRGI